MTDIQSSFFTHLYTGSNYVIRIQIQAQTNFITQIIKANRIAQVQSDYSFQVVEKDDLKIEKFFKERFKLYYYLGQMRTVFGFQF